MTDEALQRLRERLSSDQESVLFMRILEELIDWAGPPTMRGNMMNGPTNDKWIAQVFGDLDSSSWEISVVRTSNTFGQHSRGWFDENKLLISHNGGPCRWPLAPGLGQRMVDIARQYADELNSEEPPC